MFTSLARWLAGRWAPGRALRSWRCVTAALRRQPGRRRPVRAPAGIKITAGWRAGGRRRAGTRETPAAPRGGAARPSRPRRGRRGGRLREEGSARPWPSAAAGQPPGASRHETPKRRPVLLRGGGARRCFEVPLPQPPRRGTPRGEPDRTGPDRTALGSAAPAGQKRRPCRLPRVLNRGRAAARYVVRAAPRQSSKTPPPPPKPKPPCLSSVRSHGFLQPVHSPCAARSQSVGYITQVNKAALCSTTKFAVLCLVLGKNDVIPQTCLC